MNIHLNGFVSPFQPGNTCSITHTHSSDDMEKPRLVGNVSAESPWLEDETLTTAVTINLMNNISSHSLTQMWSGFPPSG